MLRIHQHRVESAPDAGALVNTPQVFDAAIGARFQRRIEILAIERPGF